MAKELRARFAQIILDDRLPPDQWNDAIERCIAAAYAAHAQEDAESVLKRFLAYISVAQDNKEIADWATAELEKLKTALAAGASE